MDKLINQYKWILVVAAVLAFLLPSNLFADKWDTYWSYYIGPDEIEYGSSSHYVWWSDVGFSGSVPNESTFGFTMWPELSADTCAYIVSYGDAYENDLSINGEVLVEADKEWEWDGPPATAPSAVVDISLSLDAEHECFIELYDPNMEADLYGVGCTITYGDYIFSYDGGEDCNGVIGVLYGDANGDVNNLNYYYHYEYPDVNDWHPYANNNAYHIEGNLYWEYSWDEYDYEIPSGMGLFSVGAYGYASSYSYVSFNTGVSEHAYIWSEQYAKTDINCSCSATSNW